MVERILFFWAGLGVAAAQPCRVEIVDKANGWPVPLVELVTTHEVRMVSDNRGWIAVDQPELLDREIWFHVKGHGYGVAKDGFGYEGLRTTLKRGGSCRIEVERRMPAKRLGRLTGAGLFAEGQKLGVEPLLPESGVSGCDSVLTTRHDGRLFWLWGDTLLPGYPLGIFHSSGATSAPMPLSSFEPPLALAFQYFRDSSGNPRGVAQMPGDGPTWLSGLVSFPNGTLGASYSKIRGFLDEYEVGLCIWNPESLHFDQQRILWKKADGTQPLIPRGHPLRWQDDNGKSWILFGDPFPTMKCPDDVESWKNPAYWKSIIAPKGAWSPGEDREITAHRGSISWNAFRRKWIAVFTHHGGKPSAFGEIWYAEADSPFGPWRDAVKVITHDNYTFYNPRIQTDLFPADAPFILIEGTYTTEFADHARPTPRYNYNQILYRLDFADLPVK
jgi:hypothetical protein